MEITGLPLVEQLAKRNEAAYEQVFKTYFKALHGYACTMLKDETHAEEMVQQVFFKLWDRADKLTIGTSLAAYLYRSVHNECLNFIRHRKVRSSHQLHVAYTIRTATSSDTGKLISKELSAKFQEALNDLPEQCRTIFQMSRFEDLKYREIADKLGLSIKTVENQMGKALRILRVKLIEFLPLLFLFFNF